MSPSGRTKGRECSIADTLDLVGQRWSFLVIREISRGVHRFTGIVAGTGAPRDMLSARLRSLEAAGVVERRRINEHAERYEYHLTSSGWELCDALLLLMQWGDRHINPEDPPLRLRHECGHEVEPALVCGHCGGPARAGLVPVTAD